MMESPVQCGCNAHAAPGFFLWQELPLKHPERMRNPMPQAAFYGDWGVSQQAENRFRVTKALLATFVRKQYPYPLHDDLLLLS